MTRLLTDEEIDRQLRDLPAWQRSGDSLTATLEAPDFPAAIRLVDEVALEAEEMSHHPDLEISWSKVTATVTTHSEGGLTANDFELARRIEARTG